MSAVDRAMIERALASPEWRATADALLQATGITLSVVDLTACEVLFAGDQCSYCRVATGINEIGPTNCYDSCPAATSGTARVTCRAGLVTHITDVPLGDRPLAHVVAGGFVTSTRERRLLFHQLVSRGVPEDTARLLMKNMPVLTRRQIDANLKIAVAALQSAVAAVAGRSAAERRARDVTLLEAIGRTAAGVDAIDERVLSGLVSDALGVIGSEAGALLVPHPGSLEVVAVAGDWRGAVGLRVPRENTASGRAAATRRLVLVPGDGAAGTSGTLSVPLTVGERIVGVLELRLGAGITGVEESAVRLLDRLGALLATVLERRREMVAVSDAVAESQQLDEIASSLARISDLEHVMRFVTGVLERSFVFDVAGMTLTSWGHDRADVIVRGTVGEDELEAVVGQVLGRNLAEHPLAELITITPGGDNEPGARFGEDWASLEVEIEAGDLLVGYLFLASDEGVVYGADDRRLLERLARHAAAALERSALFARIRDDYAATIAALSATMHAAEHLPRTQARHVMDYAVLIGEELELPVEEREQLRFAALLHDVGKAGLSEEVVLEPTRLSAADVLRLNLHADMGKTIVDQIEFLKGLTPIILHHHERWDGKGEPMGLAGSEIPLLARILAVADTFDGLTGTTSGPGHISITQARTQIEHGMSTAFDPRVVNAFCRVLDRHMLAAGVGLFASDTQRPDLPA